MNTQQQLLVDIGGAVLRILRTGSGLGKGNHEADKLDIALQAAQEECKSDALAPRMETIRAIEFEDWKKLFRGHPKLSVVVFYDQHAWVAVSLDQYCAMQGETPTIALRRLASALETLPLTPRDKSVSAPAPLWGLAGAQGGSMVSLLLTAVREEAREFATKFLEGL